MFVAQPAAPKLPGHGFYTVDGDGRGRAVRAACECGWHSVGAHNGGLAGATWDVHVMDRTDASLILAGDGVTPQPAADAMAGTRARR